MGRFLAVAFAALVSIVCVLYQSVMVNRYTRDVGRIELGSSESEVVNVVGKPSHREATNKIYARYASTPCSDPCHIRLWWEAPLLPGLEAWSVEFDRNGKAIKKTHWVSP